MYEKKFKKIINSYLLISGLYTLSASFIWGINTLFLLESGLTIFEVFVVNALFAAGMSIFEIPTGVFADTRGRRFSFLLSTIVLFIGTSGYFLTSLLLPNLILFSLFSIVLGLGFTFYSGAVEAWVVDELHYEGFDKDLDPLFSKGGTISGVCMIIGTIGGGFMGYIDLTIPYISRSIALILLFLFALLFMKEKSFTPPKERASFSSHLKRLTNESIHFGWNKKPVRLLILISFFHSIFMMWGFYASQPYFLDLLGNREAVWVSGLIAAGMSLGQISGNSLVPFLLKKVKLRSTILIIAALLITIFALTVGLSNSFLFATTSFFIFMASFGVFIPIKQSMMHQLISKDKRATILSFESLVANTGGMVGQPSLGYISKVLSISFGYIFGSISLLMVLPCIFNIRKSKEKADIVNNVQ